MKKLGFIVALFAISYAVQAQAPPQTVQRRVTLDELVIKDSSGTVYSAAIAQALLATGKYSMRIAANGKDAVLYALSEEEKKRREERAPKPNPSNFFREGAAFAPFKDRDITGNKYNLREMEGKVVVLNFWFINCPPCRREIPELNDVVEQYKNNKDVVFLAVALDSESDLEDFLKTSPFRYNVISDGRSLAGRYGINLYPTHVVLDKKKNVLFHTSGFSSGTIPWLKRSIEAGLNPAQP